MRVVQYKNESFDISFQHIPFDVFEMVYKVGAVSGLTHIEFNSVILIKQCYESVDFIIGPFVKDLLLFSFFHHICSCYIRLHVQPFMSHPQIPVVSFKRALDAFLYLYSQT